MTPSLAMPVTSLKIKSALPGALRKELTMSTQNNIASLNCQFAPLASINNWEQPCEPTIETMSSTQLAGLLGKEKSYINREIKKMFQQKIDDAKITSSKDLRGYVTDYHLPELESKMFVAKKDISYLEKITRFWIERGKLAQLPNFNDPVIAARAWADQKEARQIAEETVNALTPKVAALDRIATADGSMNITAAAKHLQVRPKDLFGWLSENKWIYRRNGNKSYLAYQNRIQQGVMEHKITTYINGDGFEQIHEQARVTPKGITKLAQIFVTALV